MRGDENQPALAKEGPRHAAPRKTLLNRIQGPAGKAMALAAMPTAVFVGMGLTPKVALADDKDFPYAPGPCVTRSDEPVTEEPTKPAETAKPTPTSTASASPTDTPTTAPTGTATPTPTPTSTEAGQATTQRTQERVNTAPAPAATPTATATPTPTPTPTKSTNPLDPLGWGDALKDLFDGPDPKPTATPTTTAPTAAPTTQAPAPATTKAPAQKAATADDPVTTTAPKATADPAAAKTKAAIEKAAEQAGVKVEELPESAKGLDAKKDEDIPEGAKPRFPCPELDEKALADAELEPGIPLLPDESWRLESSLLTLSGLKYHGIVEVRTYGGKTKKVLKFTATSVDIKDLHQMTEHSDGRTAHVRSKAGSTSTITQGTVTMYTEELKGNLIGIVPITFSAQSPPPVDLPWVFFTNVKLKQAGQFGGTLRVKDLRNTIEPN
ncbi:MULTISPECIES: hypothetical protein [unclassified Streptomyces]|uniref:hypothetical protein n=1 Tax=unclassified Streptomyces TaxID=2593676 RepID=UPI0006FC3BF6|nr:MULTISPECIES: hypothetical protein [unclassified Streptomyces]KQX47383.1 hypothetical protein ASD33_21545 [Streptomyces sp. Root1304]KRA94690.1 hypothetical protein ASE09_30760 [Streptomyces sp. Root66D1]